MSSEYQPATSMIVDVKKNELFWMYSSPRLVGYVWLLVWSGPRLHKYLDIQMFLMQEKKRSGGQRINDG